MQRPHSHSPTRPQAFVWWKDLPAALTCAGQPVTDFLLPYLKSAWEYKAKLWGVKLPSMTVTRRVTSRSGNARTEHSSPSKAKNFTLKSKLMKHLLSPKLLGQITTSQSLGLPVVPAQKRTEVKNKRSALKCTATGNKMSYSVKLIFAC